MLKIKMPRANSFVPDWAVYKPEISLWNCFE
jgi:hypothetical protein